jgi:hypothetical protein
MATASSVARAIRANMQVSSYARARKKRALGQAEQSGRMVDDRIQLTRYFGAVQFPQAHG